MISDILGFSMEAMGTPMGTPWGPMVTHGNPWEPMGTHGDPWEPTSEKKTDVRLFLLFCFCWGGGGGSGKYAGNIYESIAPSFAGSYHREDLES